MNTNEQANSNPGDRIKDLSLTEKDSIKIKRYGMKMTQKMAFCHFIEQEVVKSTDNWLCCGESFTTLPHLHIHIGKCHKAAVEKLRDYLLMLAEKAENPTPKEPPYPLSFSPSEEYPWLPVVKEKSDGLGKYRVLLFYHYRDIECTEHVRAWQTSLCERLQLTGKIRVSQEGLNGTVCGTENATNGYIEAVRKHPLFAAMSLGDFKQSDSDENVFHDGLKVGVYEEAVPMGMDPQNVSYKKTGHHLSAEEFHVAVDRYLNDPRERQNMLLLDCRNFYESRIGKFRGAVDPNLRKFSYWPEYVEKNKELFSNKKVLMYCTGGIRCERGSAYLREKGICDEVYQLDGGIHKYIEKYPEGHFRGKLFVFDDRYSIQSNNDVIAACVYCGVGWDEYRKCSSEHCHQLLLSCDDCCSHGRTACCIQCQDNARSGLRKEQCQCTRTRERAPCQVEQESSDTSTAQS